MHELAVLLPGPRGSIHSRMIRTVCSSLMLIATTGLAGCVWFSDLTEDEPESAQIVDEPAVPAPYTPTGEYDFVGSRAAAQAGDAAYAAGQLDQATEFYTNAIGSWPANAQAWTGLAAAYRGAGTGEDLDYALFFARRLSWADTVPAASAAAGFRNVADGRINRPVDDQRIKVMAEQLALYYAGLDVAQRIAQVGARAEPEDTLDALGIVPGLVGTAAMSIFFGAQAVGVFLTD